MKIRFASILKCFNVDSLFRVYLTKFYSRSEIVVIFDHNYGGGCREYIDNYIQRNSACYLLIRYNANADHYVVKILQEKVSRTLYVYSTDTIFDVIGNIYVKDIIINSLVHYKQIDIIIRRLIEIKHVTGCDISYLLHDYFPICQNYCLVRDNAYYCGVVNDDAVCSECLKNDTVQQQYNRLLVPASQWRQLFDNFFRHVDHITSFSRSSYDILLLAYPEISGIDFKIVPHTVDYLARTWRVLDFSLVVIGIIGTVNDIKGARVIEELCVSLESYGNAVRVVVIGSLLTGFTHKNLVVTGRYDKHDLPQLLQKHGVNFILIPSIWPETFSYTTEEAMTLGYPVAVFNLGAPAERVSGYDKGLILKDTSPSGVIEQILDKFTQLSVSQVISRNL